MAEWRISSWENPPTIAPRTYICGFCGDKVGPNSGYKGTYVQAGSQSSLFIFVCSSCRQPTYFDPDGRQWPGVAFGAAVEGLPADVSAVYDEARRCMSVSAYNSAVMACRKLLMHISYERGGGEQPNFKKYVDWLIENHYVPPGGEGWAHQIRDRGNEANHEIDLMDRHTAEQVLSFTEFLLKFVYELPARAGGQIAQPASAAE